jgi:hypothetical protein
MCRGRTRTAATTLFFRSSGWSEKIGRGAHNRKLSHLDLTVMTGGHDLDLTLATLLTGACGGPMLGYRPLRTSKRRACVARNDCSVVLLWCKNSDWVVFLPGRGLGVKKGKHHREGNVHSVE